MKLYDVPGNTPIIYKAADGTEYHLDFHRIDGMYSLSYYKGEPFYLIANAEVEIASDEEN